MNGVYRIWLPRDATLSELVGALRKRGRGNEWPLPSMQGWVIRSNVGDLATISEQDGAVEFLLADGSARVSSLGIKWVFGDWDGADELFGSYEGLFRH